MISGSIRRNHAWVILAAALLVASLLVAACGGGDGGGDVSAAQNAPQSDADAGTSQAAQPEPAQSETAEPEATAAEPDAKPAPFTDALTVASTDGAALLTIPAGALPAGVGPDDVRITDITAEAAALTEGVTLLAAYELRPSGLQFTKPATLTVRLPFTPGQPHTFVLLGDAGEFEVLQATLAELDLEAGEAVWALALLHFSNVHIFSNARDGLALEPRPVADVTLGETFAVEVLARRGEWETESTLRVFFIGEDAPPPITYLSFLATTGEWSLLGDFRAVGPITRRTPLNPFPRLSFTAASTFLVKQTFTCAAAGPFTISYTGNAELAIDRRSISTQGGEVISDELSTPFGPEAVIAVAGALLSGECRAQTVALASPPITTYTVDVPANAASFAWSGPDCGSVTGATTNTMVWNHGEEGCDHVGVAHPSTTIQVVITIDGLASRCTYQSAASGTGPACQPPELTPPPAEDSSEEAAAGED